MNKNDQETKLCRACNRIKPLSAFIATSKGEKGARCKLCKSKNILIPRTEKLTYSKKVKEEMGLRLRAITKQDYIDTYIFLKEVMGYDLSSEFSIHEQFCIKHNLTPNYPLNEFDKHFSIEDCKLF